MKRLVGFVLAIGLVLALGASAMAAITPGRVLTGTYMTEEQRAANGLGRGLRTRRPEPYLRLLSCPHNTFRPRSD